MRKINLVIIAAISIFAFSACNNNKNAEDSTMVADSVDVATSIVNKYVEVDLNSDLSNLSDNQREMIGVLVDIADIMEEIYWMQSYGDKDELLASVEDENTKKAIMINYGPWDRLNANTPFVEAFGAKPIGANFYPQDITKEEFDALEDEDKNSLYTILQRNEEGNLIVVWYHEAFKEKIDKAAELLLQAAELAENDGFKKYLELRAEALLTDDYYDSDYAWMTMTDNMIDFVVGPIENYEDGFTGTKAANESFILIKDIEWSDLLARFNSLLPELQKGLPVDDIYKQEVPGANSDIAVYDVVYYAGDCNAGSKTIAINLPNDERIHAALGSRKLQLKNAMQYKFDNILMPISRELIVEEQQQYITFDAFFQNTMFHEVGHGLGIKKLLASDETVRVAFGNNYSKIEEGKADILGLYMVSQLREMGEITDGELMDNYVTFFAGIFRSVRFGATSSHGVANMIRFNYFKEKGAFTRTEDGKYRINFEEMQAATSSLGAEILMMQGDGDIEKAQMWIDNYGVISEELQSDLNRLEGLNIPVDIVFNQGKDVLGLE